MLRILALALVLVSWCSQDAAAQMVRVTVERTNLRDKPAADGAIVASVAKGDELTLLERVGTWYRVRVPSTGREGYVNSLLVEPVPAGSTPQAPAAPPPAGPPAAPPPATAPPPPRQATAPPPDVAPPPTSEPVLVEFGARAGLNLATLSLDDDPEGKTSRRGLLGGVFARGWLSDSLAVQIEAQLSQQGARFEFEDSDFDINVDSALNLTYLQFPVTGLLAFGSGELRPHVFAGPSVGLRLSATAKVEDESEDVKEFVSAFDFGLVFGGGIDLGRLTFDARYLLGIKNIAIDEDGDAVSRNRVLTLSAAFRF